MGLSASEAFTISGILLGVAFLLAIFPANFVHFYIPDLLGWQYFRDVTLPSVSAAGIYVLPLPSDANFWAHVAPDCRDVRVTLVSDHEEIIPAWLVSCDPDEQEGSVAVFLPPSSSPHLRIYYGNPDADPLPAVPSDDKYFKAPPFDDRFAVARTPNAATWGVMKFKGRSRVYLLKWGKGGGVLIAQSPFSLYSTAYLRLRFGGWGHGYVFIPLSDSNDTSPTTSLSDLQSRYPAYILFSVNDRGRADYSVVSNGTTLATGTVRKKKDFSVYITPADDAVYVAFGSSSATPVRVPVTPPISRLAIYSIGYRDSTVAELRKLEYSFPRTVLSPSDVIYGPETLAPAAPTVTINSPADGAYVPSPVHIDISVSDPNDDVNAVTVTLSSDANTFDFLSLSTDLNLPDGEYTLTVTAVDSVGLSRIASVHFAVDSTLPVVELNLLSRDYNSAVYAITATDASPLTCTLITDSNTTNIPCDTNITLTSSATLRVEDAAGNYIEYSLEGPLPPSSADAGSSSDTESTTEPSGSGRRSFTYTITRTGTSSSSRSGALSVTETTTRISLFGVLLTIGMAALYLLA